MSADVERDLQAITRARAQGRVATTKVYVTLAGPGWLQSAATLGGGSLAGSLYLGILAGPNMLWLQPLAMIMGIIMLSAISYVTLSTGEPPFRTMRRHISPVLAWAWLAATVAANIVWTMPQFSLGEAAVRQNLLSSIFGADAMPVFWSKLIIGVVMAAIAISVVRRYGQGSRGVKVFENILKVFVGIIVLCFVGVVVRLTLAGDVISWGQVARGFVPDLSLLTAPAPGYDAILGRMDPTARDFWTSTILNQQRDVMIATVATAVGILGPFLWSKAAFWLAVPVSVFGMCLLPIAYVSFHLMMNSRRALGHERPAGLRRWRWNGLMTLSVSLATMGSLYSIWSKTHWVGIVSLALLVVIALVAHGARRSSAAPETRVG